MQRASAGERMEKPSSYRMAHDRLGRENESDGLPVAGFSMVADTSASPFRSGP
jgi:hypothetical protein